MSQPTPPAASSSGERLSPGARRALIASVVGTIIEWYDYALYGAAAGLIIAPLFFGGADNTLYAFGSFAVGFLVRPLGGLLLSHLGDRHGRKPALMISLALMGVATVGIGLMPTAATIGIWAPILLIALRFLQGLGAGAELSGALTVVAEFAPRSKRGFYTSLVLAGPPIGSALATMAFLAVSTLPEEQLFGGWWRVPFLASALLFIVAWWIRHHMEETPEFEATMAKQQASRKEKSVPLRELFSKSLPGVLLGFFSLSGHNVNYYLLTAFSLSFMVANAGMDRVDALLVVTIGNLFGVVCTPIGGLLADRFGPRAVMTVGMGVGVLYSFPLFWAFESGSITAILAIFVVGFGLILMTTSATQGALAAGLFPARYRYTGMAVARELNGALVGGTAPMIAAALVTADNGGITYAAGYLLLAFLSSFIALIIASPKRVEQDDTRQAVSTLSTEE